MSDCVDVTAELEEARKFWNTKDPDLQKKALETFFNNVNDKRARMCLSWVFHGKSRGLNLDERLKIFAEYIQKRTTYEDKNTLWELIFNPKTLPICLKSIMTRCGQKDQIFADRFLTECKNNPALASDFLLNCTGEDEIAKKNKTIFKIIANNPEFFKSFCSIGIKNITNAHTKNEVLNLISGLKDDKLQDNKLQNIILDLNLMFNFKKTIISRLEQCKSNALERIPIGMEQRCIEYYERAIMQFSIDTSTNNSAEFLKKYVCISKLNAFSMNFSQNGDDLLALFRVSIDVLENEQKKNEILKSIFELSKLPIDSRCPFNIYIVMIYKVVNELIHEYMQFCPQDLWNFVHDYPIIQEINYDHIEDSVFSEPFYANLKTQLHIIQFLNIMASEENTRHRNIILVQNYSYVD